MSLNALYTESVATKLFFLSKHTFQTETAEVESIILCILYHLKAFLFLLLLLQLSSFKLKTVACADGLEAHQSLSAV